MDATAEVKLAEDHGVRGCGVQFLFGGLFRGNSLVANLGQFEDRWVALVAGWSVSFYPCHLKDTHANAWKSLVKCTELSRAGKKWVPSIYKNKQQKATTKFFEFFCRVLIYLTHCAMFHSCVGNAIA